jgi:hypothetical protein
MLQIIAYYCTQSYFVKSLTLQHPYNEKDTILLFTRLPRRGLLGNLTADSSHSRKLSFRLENLSDTQRQTEKKGESDLLFEATGVYLGPIL